MGHDNEKCEEYCRRYKIFFDQELPDCQFKGNKSKIQSLIRKVHIDADGSVTEVQFDNKRSNEDHKIAVAENQDTPKSYNDNMKIHKKKNAKNEGSTSLLTKMKS